MKEGKRTFSKFPSFQLKIVGVARFELTISWSQTKRDTGLRYTPKSRQIYTEKRLNGLPKGSLVISPEFDQNRNL